MGRIHLKSSQEIEIIRANGRLAAQTLLMLEKAVTPGITTLALDRMAEQFIRDHQALPSFKGYHGFPSSVCCSVNEQVVHGIPNAKKLQEGDIITLDVGVYKNGYHGDSAITVAVGNITTEAQQLMKVTKEALYLGIQQAQSGERLGDIGYAIESFVKKYGYGVVREYTGHGVGRELHEAPHVLHYGKANTGIRLKVGMVFTIEPMITMGSHEIQVKKDGWTAVTKDKSLCAQFEHTITITPNGPDILTLP
ncbi:methionine aminopeptidase [Candidatus Vecturithrix granuli]|uniref:Methionine aminopeptidase n=1 Tax=Vecturithrix granuli TaxID=1499967 RepID=A0A0S6W8W4_VECG1|nr:methionine aminopeptidase [Candidatus Vecturithrix granuli]